MSILKSLLDLLYPPRCPFCQGVVSASHDNKKPPGGTFPPLAAAAVEEGLLCGGCAAELPWLEEGCPRCAFPLPNRESPCRWCSGRRLAFEECSAVGSYSGKMREALHRFKYLRQVDLAGQLGRLLAFRLAGVPWISTVELVVPVALCRERLQERGYNQAALLAAAVGKELRLPVQEALERLKSTPSQTAFNRRQRTENLRNAFACPQKLHSSGHVLLVDDVLTTGATAGEASRALKKAGARRVSAAVLAR